MPAAIGESGKRRVIQQWLSGEARDKIASDLKIGSGTVSNIVNEFKKNLQGSDIDSVRELASEARKQGFTLSGLAQHIRFHNFLIESGASEEKVESFIANVQLIDIPSEKVIQYLNQIHRIAKEESIPLDEISDFVKRKIEEKKKIEHELRETDSILQSKNVSIQAINEHIQLNEKLKEQGLSTKDIEKLLNLIDNAKEYGFDSKKIVGGMKRDI